jgi:chromosome segregation ATPase
MTRLERLLIALLLTLGVALAASVGMVLRQSRRLAALQRQQAADQQALREAREALRQRELQKAPAEPESPAPLGAYQATLAKRNVTIEGLSRELDEAQAHIKELQAQLSNASDEHEKALASANELHQKEREDWQSQLDALKQQLESAQADSQASRQRLAALETDNARLKADNGAAATRAAELGRVLAELQDLDSRRDAYLTSIMRRYRDITSQFRAMSGMLASTRDSNSTSPFNDAALTRIQSAVSAADDDLRQLTELNAQARQLEKKLAKK